MSSLEWAYFKCHGENCLVINGQKPLQTSVQNRIVMGFNYWMLRRIALSPRTSWNQSSNSLLTWVLDLAQNLACSQGWCFSLRLYFSYMRVWSINKDNFETCRLLQIHTVDVDSESRNSHAGGEWEMVTEMVCTKWVLERTSPSPGGKDKKIGSRNHWR